MELFHFKFYALWPSFGLWGLDAFFNHVFFSSAFHKIQVQQSTFHNPHNAACRSHTLSILKTGTLFKHAHPLILLSSSSVCLKVWRAIQTPPTTHTPQHATVNCHACIFCARPIFQWYIIDDLNHNLLFTCLDSRLVCESHIDDMHGPRYLIY